MIEDDRLDAGGRRPGQPGAPSAGSRSRRRSGRLSRPSRDRVDERLQVAAAAGNQHANRRAAGIRLAAGRRVPDHRYVHAALAALDRADDRRARFAGRPQVAAAPLGDLPAATDDDQARCPC